MEAGIRIAVPQHRRLSMAEGKEGDPGGGNAGGGSRKPTKKAPKKK
jgi:hypothetical protein